MEKSLLNSLIVTSNSQNVKFLLQNMRIFNFKIFISLIGKREPC